MADYFIGKTVNRNSEFYVKLKRAVLIFAKRTTILASVFYEDPRGTMADADRYICKLLNSIRPRL
jgi:hypothetical protein